MEGVERKYNSKVLHFAVEKILLVIVKLHKLFEHLQDVLDKNIYSYKELCGLVIFSKYFYRRLIYRGFTFHHKNDLFIRDLNLAVDCNMLLQ